MGDVCASITLDDKTALAIINDNQLLIIGEKCSNIKANLGPATKEHMKRIQHALKMLIPMANS